MAEELNPQEEGAVPPKQSPFKTVGPAANPAAGGPAASPAPGGAGAAPGTAPKTILLRRPTLRRPGEPPTATTRSPLSPIAPAAEAAAPASPTLSGDAPTLAPPRPGAPATTPPPSLKPAASDATPAASPISLAKPAPAASPISLAKPAAPAAAPAASPISPARPGAPTVPTPAKPLSDTAKVAQGIAISHTEAAKKMTSRISVSSATSSIPPISPAAAPATPASEAPTLAAKKMTSRITLESAFNTQPDLPASQPKTIRLKRPSEVISAAKPAVPPPPAPPSEPLPEGMTPISEAEEPAKGGDEQMTRRKTIKVKRPGGGGGGPKISLSRPGEGEGSGPAPIGDENLQNLSSFGTGPAVAAPDTVNPVFIVAAIVAIIFGSVLVWTLLSQSYGERGAAGDFALPKGPTISPPPGLTTFD